MPQQNQRESLSSLLSAKAICHLDPSDLTGLVIVFNSESCYHFYTNRNFRRVVESCKYICVDGIGVRLALLLRGYNVRRYHGPDVLSDIVSSGESKKYKLLGGAPELTNAEICHVFHSHVPLPISDDINRLFATALKSLEISDSAESRFFVSLGLPKQELFSGLLADYLKRTGKHGVIIPIGAAVDFYFGYKTRSSRLWQKIGLEWLPRLVREPRMFPRIIRSAIGIIRLAFGR